jgi:branched-chain amino acid transport system substrate-binding protein
LDPCVTETAILVGGTAPLRVEASFARGAQAFLRHASAGRGAGGRAVEYRLLDDGGDPARALAATRSLVEREGAFALFGTVGTASALAVRPYLTAAGVPHAFPASGASGLAGLRPTFRAEGRILGSFVARTRPRALLGVLHGADAEGRELLAGLREGVAGTRVRVLARPLDAAVGPEGQIAELEEAGAGVVALLLPRATAAAAAAAATAPLLLTADAAAGGQWPAGAVAISWAKDPADPRWRDDEALRPYRSLLRGRGLAHVQGMAAAYELVRLLRGLGPEPTRAALAARLARTTSAANPFLLPGVVVRTGPGDSVPVDAAGLRRSTGTGWRALGGLWRDRGR